LTAYLKDWPTEPRGGNGWVLLSRDRVAVWRYDVRSGRLAKYAVEAQEAAAYLPSIPGWRSRFDPCRGEWCVFPAGLLRTPGWASDTASATPAEDEKWQQANSSWFTDEDWTVLCGNIIAPEPLNIASAQAVVPTHNSGVRRVVPTQPLTTAEDWGLETLIDHGHSAIRQPSLQDVLTQYGFEWRQDELSAGVVPVFRRNIILRRNDVPVEGVHFDIAWDDRVALDAAEPKSKPELTRLELCLEALGASRSGMISSRDRLKADHALIAREQIEALGLSELQARELIDFVARLAALGTDLGLSRDGQDESLARATGKAPAWDGWMYATHRQARTWSLIRRWNLWSVEDGWAETWSLDIKGQRHTSWEPAWFLSYAGAPKDSTVVLFHATIVCQVLISGRFHSPNELVLYCVESGIRVSTPREMKPMSDTFKADREHRMKTRESYKLGYRASDHKFTMRDYVAYKTNVRAAFRDPAIVRAAVMSGGFAWRISVEHCYPDVALDGPSDDALRLGIGQRFRKELSPNRFVHLIDDHLGSEVELYLLGGWYNKIGDVATNPDVLRTCWPRTATWESFSSPGWDARKEATYQWIRGGYLTPARSNSEHSQTQPQSSAGWKSRLRNRDLVARKIAAAAEVYAASFLDTRAGYEYRRATAANEVRLRVTLLCFMSNLLHQPPVA
jgi:hypothetical protein